MKDWEIPYLLLFHVLPMSPSCLVPPQLEAHQSTDEVNNHGDKQEHHRCYLSAFHPAEHCIHWRVK